MMNTVVLLFFVAWSSSNKDRQEGGTRNNREILHTSDVGLPHQQADMRGNSNHSQQEAA